MSRQLFEYHPVLGYRFVPNLQARVPHESGGYLVQANASGFRSSREFVAEATPAIRRGLFFGDSFTAGDGVSNGRRYTDRLEGLIPNFEAYNYGLSGTGTGQQYLAWREFAQGVAHDVVVIAVLVENVRRVTARYRRFVDDRGHELVYAKPYFQLDGERLTLHQVPPPRAPIPIESLAASEQGTVDRGGRFETLRKVVASLGARELVQRVTRYQPVPEYDAPDNPGWRLLRAILTAWIQSVARPVIVMPLPLYQHVEETSDALAYQSRFRELCGALGCTLHDPLPDLLRYPLAERRRFRFPHDVHPTAEGHAALAASLAPTLARVLEFAPPAS